jgi:hypothetical protein
MRALLLAGVAAAACLVTIAPGDASTPWAMVARRAIGRVEQMTQPPKDGQPGFDVATVVLNADAAKVYATTVGMLQRNQMVHVVSEDAAHRSVQFANGARSAGITVTELGAGLAQMVVASAVMPGQDSATLRIVDGILRVCQQLKVACSAH